MNAEQILKLLDAGYTKADIDAMNMAPEAQPVQEAQPEAQPVQEAQQKTQPVQEAQPEVQPVLEVPVETEAEKRLTRIENIIEKMAANGIASSSAPAPEEKKNVVAEILEHL